MNYPSLFGTWALLVATPWMATAQEAEIIRWRLESGERFAVELTQITSIATNIDARSKQIGNDMRLFMDWQVESVKDDVFTIEQSINRIVLKINAPSKSGSATTQVDTDGESPDRELGAELLRQIKPLIGTRYSVEMNSRGEIVDVTVSRESMDRLRNAPASMRLREVLTEDGLKDLIGQSAIVFPEQAIAPGESWSSSVEMAGALGKMNRTSTCTFRGAEEIDGADGLAFDVSTDITSINGATDVADQAETVDDGPKVQGRIESFSGTGTIRFAPANANVLTSTFKNAMRTQRSYRDQSIVTTVNSDVAMKVTKK